MAFHSLYLLVEVCEKQAKAKDKDGTSQHIRAVACSGQGAKSLQAERGKNTKLTTQAASTENLLQAS